MQINKHGSFYIRNGWPTKIIDAINVDQTIFSPNNELAAVDQIGVGRVMIKSMRYWSVVTGIANEHKAPQGVTQQLTKLGEKIAKYDPYCQDKGTLWLMHRHLARSQDEATAWWWLFNNFEVQSFTKESFTESFYAYLQRNGGKYIRKTVDKEFDCVKNTYVSDRAFDVHKILDEDTVPFFASLGLIRFIGSGTFEKRKSQVKDIPLDILHYAILADNREKLATSSQIDLDLLLDGDKQVGRYLNLSYSTLLELLQQLENSKKIQLVNNFGSRYIHVLDNDPDAVLNEHYLGVTR